MATRINNSETMSADRILNILTNTINRTTEKSVQNANYDKTILATIQYCTDEASGQYKIKYQNGYYTAYAQNPQDYVYSNGTAVFVTVPQNNLSNRLFITGSATNNSDDKIYLTNLEEDQQYKASAPSIITDGPLVSEGLNMSSYWSLTRSDNNEYEQVLYSADDEANSILALTDNGNLSLATEDYFKFSAKFKTNFKTQARKAQGDYGVRIYIKYKTDAGEDEIKIYELNTFNMAGAPFDFTDPVPQIAYWQMDNESSTFVRIEKISAYVRNFTDATTEEEADDKDDTTFRDIFISDFNIQPAIKLYDSTNDTYKVSLYSNDSFRVDQNKATIHVEAALQVLGNEVKPDSGQNIQYFWGKKDSSVKSVTHTRYNSYLGAGWYCLNTGTKTQSDANSVASLKQESLNEVQPGDNTNALSNQIEWNGNAKELLIPKTLCKAKETTIKCVVVYSGAAYESQLKDIINDGGYYVLIGSQNDKKVSYNGQGYFTIAAGVFKDGTALEPIDAPDGSQTLNTNMTYYWTETKNGITRDLPLSSPEDILLSNPEWSPTKEENNVTVHQDDEYATDADVTYYLKHDGALVDEDLDRKYCIERYNSYKSKYDYYYKMSAEQQAADPDYATKLQRCFNRYSAIIPGKMEYIADRFSDTVTNEYGYYILGPSDVEAEYSVGVGKTYLNAAISEIDPRDAAGDTRPAVYNTLYKLPAKNISTTATYTVSVVFHDTTEGRDEYYEIGTKSITLTNDNNNVVDYTLKITNGVQTFLYDEAGRSPSSKYALQPISIKPLSFVLLNKTGDPLYDSANPDDYDIDISQLKPIWSFYNPLYSLLKTNYIGSNGARASQSDPNWYELDKNEAFFYYDLVENFDVDYKETSNVQLQIIYQGQTVSTITSFTFSKQGDVGTNGTNRTLNIISNAYENYKNVALTTAKYCNFDPQNIIDTPMEKGLHAAPSQRHLRGPYLYATDTYSQLSAGALCSMGAGNYVNLHIAQNIKVLDEIQDGEEGIGIDDSDNAAFQLFWYPNYGDNGANLNNAKWIIPQSETIKSGSNYTYYYPPFSASVLTGREISVRLNVVNDEPELAYCPSILDGFSKDGQMGRRIGNNILGAMANVPTSDDITRNCYTYLPIPYFYFNWTYNSNTSSEMPPYIDPARHIVITGGFDQVVYDSAGRNPQYNGKEPFRFYIFDEKNVNITKDVLYAASQGNATIQWECSGGFTKRGYGQQYLRDIPNFSSLSGEVNEGSYCRNNGVIYKCINSYNINQTQELNTGYWPPEMRPGTEPRTAIEQTSEYTIYVYNATGQETKSYNLISGRCFVEEYWIEIDEDSLYQAMTFTPADVYSSMVEKDSFNSWIRLTVRYDKYEAEAFIPINVISNIYGSPELNEWDGKKLKIDENENGSYMIANKVAAGIKDDRNAFHGITIGQAMYIENNERKKEIGVFGYGVPNGKNSVERTLFLDSETGRAIFGADGASQIVLDPAEDRWSSLGGWYFSKNYLFKPVSGNTQYTFDALARNAQIDFTRPSGPTDSFNGLGLYVPGDQDVLDSDIAIWVGATDSSAIQPGSRPRDPGRNANFRVQYDGHLYASDIDVRGKITATSGNIGGTTDGIAINYQTTDTYNNTHRYILYNQNFWVESSTTSALGTDGVSAGIKGRIMAKSGQIGSVNESSTPDNSTDVLFLNYKWYAWSPPADNQPYSASTDYFDRQHGQNTVYPILHKNFFVDPTGNVVMQGKIYSVAGRIGGWVIGSNQLKTTNNNVTLGSDGNATFGAFHIENTGRIYGPQWFINADGSASFTNPANVYQGSSVTIGNSTWANGVLHLDEGETFEIGNGAGLTSVSGAGFKFTGTGCRFDVGSVILGGSTNTNLTMMSGAKITLSEGLILDNTGIHMGYGGGSYGINNDGTAKFKSISIGGDTYRFVNNGDLYAHDINANSITINGTSLEDYIKDVITANVSLSKTTGYAMNSAGTDSIKVVTNVSLN